MNKFFRIIILFFIFNIANICLGLQIKKDIEPRISIFPKHVYRIGVDTLIYHDFFQAEYVKNQLLNNLFKLGKYEIIEADLLTKRLENRRIGIKIGDRNNKNFQNFRKYEYKKNFYYKVDIVISGRIIEMQDTMRKRDPYIKIILDLYQPATGRIIWHSLVSGKLNNIAKYLINIINKGTIK